MRRGEVISLRELVRPVLYVSEAITIGALLARFREERQHLAMLLDEYGGTAGLIALEDLLEELVGDVQDVFGTSGSEVELLPDGSALISGLMPIDEVNERFGLDARPQLETMAGFILGQLERMARQGDEVSLGPVQLRVEVMDELRIDRVRLSAIPAAPTAGDSSGELASSPEDLPSGPDA